MIELGVLSEFLGSLSLAILVIIIIWLSYNIFISLNSYKHSKSFKYRYSSHSFHPKISIIIPAKDEERVIGRLLDSILDQDYPRDKIEVIIVDGASKDGTYEIARSYAEKYDIFKVVKEDTSKGKPHGLNMGLKYVSGDIVGIFDADSILTPDLLRKVSTVFNNKNIVAVQGKVISLNESQNILTSLVVLEEKAWYNLIMKGRERLGLFIPLTGNCFFVRKNILARLGGFKEDELAEDIELSLRLYKYGYKVSYEDEIYSYQEAPSKLSSLISQHTRWYRGYIKNLIRYRSLIKINNLKTIDIEFLLAGPLILTLSLMGYMLVIFDSLLNVSTLYTFPLAILINILTVVSIGVILFLNRPITVSKVLVALSIYMYWILEAFIAAKSLLEELFHRPPVWRRTEKLGWHQGNMIKTG